MNIDLKKADAAYKAFPTFAVWSEAVKIDKGRWESYANDLKELRRANSHLLAESIQVVKRAAAIDTGAIEGLYEVDRGFTFTVATQAAHWEKALLEKGQHVLAFFESQLRAYEYVLDFATKRLPIAEAWVRSLHTEICRPQETYQVWTELGPQEQALPKGEYKHLPNHVLGADGRVHPYAPVDMTPPEMYRLCEELRSDAFNASHPVLQAAYSHYAFVAIHPFADGNGRVARALASVFTYRAESIPLLILVDHRKSYFEALANADTGSYQPFVDFVYERGLDAVRLTIEGFRTAGITSATQSLEQLTRLYITKAGHTHKEVDEAGYRLFDLFTQEITRQLSALPDNNMLHIKADARNDPHPIQKASYRLPISPNGPRGIVVNFRTIAPAAAAINLVFALEVPLDPDAEAELAIVEIAHLNERLSVRLKELLPLPASVVSLLVRMKVEGMIAKTVEDLLALARKQLGRAP